MDSPTSDSISSARAENRDAQHVSKLEVQETKIQVEHTNGYLKFQHKQRLGGMEIEIGHQLFAIQILIQTKGHQITIKILPEGKTLIVPQL